MAANTRKPSATAQAAKAAGARTPADHQTAVQDIDPKAFTIEFEGHEYTADIDVMEDLDFLERIEQSLIQGIRMIIGFDGYKQLKANLKEDKGRATGDDLNRFFEALNKQSAFLRD